MDILTYVISRARLLCNSMCVDTWIFRIQVFRHVANYIKIDFEKDFFPPHTRTFRALTPVFLVRVHEMNSAMKIKILTM